MIQALAWGINENKWELELNISGALYQSHFWCNLFILPSLFRMSLLHTFLLLSTPFYLLLVLYLNLFFYIKKTKELLDTNRTHVFSLTSVGKMFKQALWNIISNAKPSSERLHPCSVLTHVLRACQQQESLHGVRSIRK